MNRNLQLKQDLGTAVDKASAFVVKARTENRAMTSEEITSYNSAMEDVVRFRDTLKAEEQDAEIQKLVKNTRDKRKREGDSGADPDEQRDAFNRFIRVGIEGMSSEERSLMRRPADVEERGNPQSDVTGNLGQYTVPQDFYAQVVTAMKWFGGMNACGATIINSSNGRDLPIPTSNDTATAGIELAENTQVSTPTEVPFGQVTMKAYKYTTRLILVPYELLQDSGVDIEAYLVKMLAVRLARILNTRFTTGSGTSQPRGVTLDAVLGNTSQTGKSQVPQYADYVGLKYSVDKAYRPNGKFMMSDTTWKSVMTLVDGQSRPLILDYLRAISTDAEEALLGDPVIINNDMANYGTAGSPVVGNIAVLYGDFSNYWIRTVKELQMLRLVERYADYGQVGFLGFARYDGRMVDAGTNPIKYMQSPTS